MQVRAFERYIPLSLALFVFGRLHSMKRLIRVSTVFLQNVVYNFE